MASTAAFCGNPRNTSMSLTVGGSLSGTFTSGAQGSLVRRIWVNAVSDDPELVVSVVAGSVPLGCVTLIPTTIARADISLWAQCTDLMLTPLFPGVAEAVDRYFEMGHVEDLTFTALKTDGSALVAGERVDVRVIGMDY